MTGSSSTRLVAHSGGGLARVTGSVVLKKLDHPVLDLRVIANEARVLDNARGQLVVSSNLAFKGPVDTLAVNGSLTVMHGVIRIPDPEQWRLINTGDPVLFSVADTALTGELQIEPPSPMLENANVNVRLNVRRGTWARSREANIEVFGDLAIERATGDEEIKVTGALHSDYGDYELYGRRFSVIARLRALHGIAGQPAAAAAGEARSSSGRPRAIRHPGHDRWNARSSLTSRSRARRSQLSRSRTSSRSSRSASRRRRSCSSRDRDWKAVASQARRWPATLRRSPPDSSPPSRSVRCSRSSNPTSPRRRLRTSSTSGLRISRRA